MEFGLKRALFERSELRSAEFHEHRRKPEGQRIGSSGFGYFCRNKSNTRAEEKDEKNIADAARVILPTGTSP